jgi:hypothetical protein
VLPEGTPLISFNSRTLKHLVHQVPMYKCSHLKHSLHPLISHLFQKLTIMLTRKFHQLESFLTLIKFKLCLQIVMRVHIIEMGIGNTQLKTDDEETRK